MRKSAFTPFAVAALASLTASCQKIPDPTFGDVTLKPTPAPFRDAIPAAYGQLVSVTPTPVPYVAVMWFKRKDESIVAVRVNYSRGGLGPNVIEISRK